MFFEVPDLNVEGGELHAYDPDTGATIHLWTKNGEYHRGGDKPAYITSGGSCWFLVEGIKHRVNGAASIIAAKDSRTVTVLRTYVENKTFYLYGYLADKHVFRHIHTVAIKYELPLWVAVFGDLFRDKSKANELSLEAFASEATKIMKIAPNVNVAWFAKLWGLSPDTIVWNSSTEVLASSFLKNMQKIVEAEKREMVSVEAVT